MEPDAFLRMLELPGTVAAVPATVIWETPYIAVTPLCNLLGVRPERQRIKLKEKDWAAWKVFALLNDVTHEVRQYFMVDAPTLQRWLDELDPRWIPNDRRATHLNLRQRAAGALNNLEI